MLSPSGIVVDRRGLAAKDVSERGETQPLGEGKRVSEGLGASYRCPQLIEGPVRVTEDPGVPMVTILPLIPSRRFAGEVEAMLSGPGSAVRQRRI